MHPDCEHLQTVEKPVGRKNSLNFKPKGIYCFIVMVVLAAVLQTFPSNVQAKAVLRAKKTLKLLQHPPSLIKLRHKRDAFADEGSDDYDDNYDVLPNFSASSQPPTVGDFVSEQAKQIADSFKKMWQSLNDSVRHCIDALRAMFGDEPLGNEDLTPEQEQEMLASLKAKYRLQQAHDNEVLSDAYENQV